MYLDDEDLCVLAVAAITIGWSRRTDVMDQGQVKDIRIDTVNYGPDGQLQRSVVNDQSSPLPLGFVRRRIVEFEHKKVEEYLVGLIKSGTGDPLSGLLLLSALLFVAFLLTHFGRFAVK